MFILYWGDIFKNYLDIALSSMSYEDRCVVEKSLGSPYLILHDGKFYFLHTDN